jgi:hypothetical protein
MPLWDQEIPTYPVYWITEQETIQVNLELRHFVEYMDIVDKDSPKAIWILQMVYQQRDILILQESGCSSQITSTLVTQLPRNSKASLIMKPE